MRRSAADGAMSVFKSVYGLPYEIKCVCDQTDEVVDQSLLRECPKASSAQMKTKRLEDDTSGNKEGEM